MRAGEIDGFVGEWLKRYKSDKPFIRGAYRVGSTAELPENSEIDSCSDIDVMLVTDGSEAREKPGKLPVSGCVIEATYLPWDSIRDAERSLRDYHVAHGLNLGRVLFDRDGELTALCARVASEFPKPERVMERARGALAKVEKGLDGFPADGKPYARLISLAFNAGILLHAVLVAAKKNPTVRMRYPAARAVLLPIGEQAAYEGLLRAAGYEQVKAEEARRLVCDMAEVYDHISPRRETHFFFTSDLAPEMRKTAVDDMLSLIDSGLPREALFWTIATMCRLMQQADADAPELYKRYLPRLLDAMELVGLGTPEKERERVSQIRAWIPETLALANRIADTY